MTEIKGDIPEIIRLQLRKPTSWGWELSTFKPSRSVTLPTIQLYNYKGQLLVEAKDNGETERSWRSSTMPNKGSAANVETESGAPGTRHLKRSRSDTLGHNSSANISRNKFESINRKDRNRQPNNKIKSFDASLDNSATKATTDIAKENRGSESKATKVITEIERGTENSHSSLKKSKSDASEQKGNLLRKPSIYKRNSFQTFQEFVQNSEARHQQRSKSDEFLRRKLRSSEESVKRAELDGYINFIKPNIPHHKSQDKPNRNKKLLTTAETVLVDNNPSSITVNDYKPKKYRTRTSSAGTLIISEESFNDAHHRRRRRNVADADQTLMERKSVDVQSSARKSDAGVDTEGVRDGVQLINGSASSISGKYAFNPRPTVRETPIVGNLSLGTRATTADLDRRRHDFNNGVQKYNTLQGISNGNSARTTQYVRHDSDPINSISRRQAFNRNVDITHSRSSGTITNSDNCYSSSNINGKTINRTSSKGKTDLTNSFLKNPDTSTKTLGFTKYVRPISDPTSWISGKYAFNPRQQIPEINNWQKLRNGLDNSTPAGVNAADTLKHGRQISDPTSSISRRYLSNGNSSVTKTSNGVTLSNSFNNSTNDVCTTSYSRYISNPRSLTPRSYVPNRHSVIPEVGNRNLLRETDKTTGKQINPSASLFYSLSDVFPFREIVDDKIDANLNDNCNYVVLEPITPSTPSESRKNSEPIIEKLDRNERRKVCGRDSDGSPSSNAIEKGSRTKDSACVV